MAYQFLLYAQIYHNNRDDLVMFYFREGANFASVYTQSKIISENIKWNLNQKAKKIYSLVVNTRNANAFTGDQGYESMGKNCVRYFSRLSDKQKEDEDNPEKLNLEISCLDVQAQLEKSFQRKKF